MKYFQYIIMVVVFAALAAGFFLAGSPKSARHQRFDERRINDLQNLQYQVFAHWERTGMLPASLAQLTESVVGYNTLNDPESQQPYEYALLAPEQYQVCAVFALSTLESSAGRGQAFPRRIQPSYYTDPYYMGSYTWDHAAGRHCFTRTIDVAQYEKDHPLR